MTLRIGERPRLGRTWDACKNPLVAGDPEETDRLARAITERARSGFALVAIDGPGGSGKSTLAAEVVEHLGAPERATVVHGDDFYRPMPPEARLLLSRQEGYDRYFDWQRLRNQVLIPLASGAAAHYERYDWPTGQMAAGELHQVSRSGVVIIEGVFTARPELAGYYDLTVWVDAPREVCMRRLDERGHDHGPGNWNERWRAAEACFFPGRPHRRRRPDRPSLVVLHGGPDIGHSYLLPGPSP